MEGSISNVQPSCIMVGTCMQGLPVTVCSTTILDRFVGWGKVTGALEQLATGGAGVPNTIPSAGVWMSGGGIASDG
jgi:hypothetical protein